MLIITRVATRHEKYVPVTQQKTWCVRDTDIKKVVYGPDIHSACMRFIRDKECD
jgi:hypothetical protein